jgi:AAA-like domain
MKLHLRAIADHLYFGRDGTVLAAWQVTPRTTRYAADDAKHALFAQVRGALKGIPARAELLSVCRLVDPAEVAEAMLDGVIVADGDHQRFPGWAAEVDATLSYLVQMSDEGGELGRLRRRETYLLCELPTRRQSWWQTVQLAVASTTSGLMAPKPPSDAELERALAAAGQVEARLGHSLGLDRVTPGRLRWLLARARKRALPDEPIYDRSWEPAHRWVQVLRPLGDAELNHPDDLPRHRLAPRHVPVRTITRTGEEETSYQAILLASDLPQEWVYPGGELFSRLDGLPFAVDWKVFLDVTDNATAKRRVRKRARKLTDQYDEWETDEAGAPADLVVAHEDILAAQADLARDRRAPMLETTIALTVAAPDPAELRGRVEQVKELLDPSDYGVERPAGAQRALFAATLPAARLPGDLRRDYCRHLLPDGVAGLMPMVTEEAGDDRGLLVGYNLDAGTLRPVLWDPSPGSGRDDTSKSTAFIASSGCGKSYSAKQAAAKVLLRGGRVVGLDRTQDREWVRFAEAMGGQVVELHSGADLCLDPLRVFADPADRERYATGALFILTGVAPRSFEGVELVEAVRTVLAQPAGRLHDVVEVLGHRRQFEPELRHLHRQLESLAAGGGIARMLFGDGRILDLLEPCIVFSAADMALPDRDTPPDKLLPEEIAGLALLYLVAAITGTSVMRDRRFGVAVFDEAYFLTGNPWGLALLVQIMRDGRKHNSAVWVLSQFADDLADERLRGLFGYRFVGGQSSAQAARASLAFLGADPSDAHVGLLQSLADADAGKRRADDGHGKGQFLFRDLRGRIAWIQVLADLDPDRHEAFKTTPAEVTT